jgi:hypothetical protein
MTMELNLVEPDHIAQQRVQARPTAQKRDRFSEGHAVIQFGEADHIAATSAAVTVEQVFVRVEKETRLVISMQRAQAHESAASDAPHWLPILSLQIIQ